MVFNHVTPADRIVVLSHFSFGYTPTILDLSDLDLPAVVFLKSVDLLPVVKPCILPGFTEIIKLSALFLKYFFTFKEDGSDQLSPHSRTITG
jgi:hypothetical protein